MYEEEDTDLPWAYRRLTAHMHIDNPDFQRKLHAYLATQLESRRQLNQAVLNSYHHYPQIHGAQAQAHAHAHAEAHADAHTPLMNPHVASLMGPAWALPTTPGPADAPPPSAHHRHASSPPARTSPGPAQLKSPPTGTKRKRPTATPPPRPPPHQRHRSLGQPAPTPTYGPLTPALPIEAQQMLFDNPWLDLSDPQMGLDPAPRPLGYTYNPNGRPARPGQPPKAQGLDQTLFALDAAAPFEPAPDAADADHPLFPAPDPFAFSAGPDVFHPPGGGSGGSGGSGSSNATATGDLTPPQDADGWMNSFFNDGAFDEAPA